MNIFSQPGNSVEPVILSFLCEPDEGSLAIDLHLLTLTCCFTGEYSEFLLPTGLCTLLKNQVADSAIVEILRTRCSYILSLRASGRILTMQKLR